MTSAAQRWADDLASWAIPPDILERAPEPPWGFPVACFARGAEMALAEELGIGRDRVYIANVVKCRPPGNRDPRPEEVASCRPYLERQIELVDPAVIVTLGNFATRLLLDATEGIRALRGSAYPYGRAVVVPTFHPSFVLRSGGMGEAMAGLRADLVRAKEHLRVRA